MKQVTSSGRAVLHIAVTGVMTGSVMAFTFIGINIGSAYVNLGDAMVLTAAALFGPATAAIAGGLGAMFADVCRPYRVPRHVRLYFGDKSG